MSRFSNCKRAKQLKHLEIYARAKYTSIPEHVRCMTTAENNDGLSNHEITDTVKCFKEI